ncbi:MAG: helix-turn-helix domain-containing protein [Oscillospiraceae bacterium]
MIIGSIGYNHEHDSSFVMDRPNGPGAGLFLLIKTAAVFEINGIRQNVRENSVVIISPHMPCRYHALDGIYADDWFYFDADKTALDRFSELEIPVDKVVYLGNIEELSHIIHIMTYEHYSPEKYHEESEQHYLELLLIKLSRRLASISAPSASSFSKHNAVFTHIRSRIYTEPSNVGSIDELAKEASLSRSGFQTAYKKIYGISIKNDILKGRFEFAKRLLSSTNLTVEEISRQSGYSSAFSFMRQFKNECGKTPTEYRKGK